MMPAYRFTALAKIDFIEIGRYTQSTWGQKQRRKYLSLLMAGIQGLSEMPFKGKSCEDIRKGYRKIQIENHIVYYQQTKRSGIEIIRIIHEHADVASHFLM